MTGSGAVAGSQAVSKADNDRRRRLRFGKRWWNEQQSSEKQGAAGHMKIVAGRAGQTACASKDVLERELEWRESGELDD